jgi:phenylacetic acid degradation operon negative regulatory protein
VTTTAGPAAFRDVLIGEVQPRELIVTIYGLYARAEQNWVSVAAVVRLMMDLDVDGAAVRSSVSRLKRRDVLRSVRVNGAAGYALSPSTLAVLEEGDARIFHRRRAVLTDGWVLLVFSVPESERDRRHELRSQLTRLGFGTAAPGVWVAPGNLAKETRDVLHRRGLTSYVDIFHGDHLAFGDLSAKVRTWWDLDELAALYARFLRRYRPVLKRWSTRPSAATAAFPEYVHMLTVWRRLPYLDPGLPLELLPHNWNGVLAAELFSELDAVLREPSRQHALSVIRGQPAASLSRSVK